MAEDDLIPNMTSQLTLFGRTFFKKAQALSRIDGLPLDAVGVREEAERRGSVIGIAKAWSEALSNTADGSSVESLAAPLTFQRTPLVRKIKCTLKTESNKRFVFDDFAYEYSQETTTGDGAPPSDLPLISGLRVQVLRLSAKNSPEMKSLYDAGAEDGDDPKPKPLTLTRDGVAPPVSLVFNAPRLARLVKTGLVTTQVAFFFPKSPLTAGQAFTDNVVREQGGFTVAIVGKEYLRWLVFCDFPSGAPRALSTSAAAASSSWSSITPLSAVGEGETMVGPAVFPNFTDESRTPIIVKRDIVKIADLASAMTPEQTEVKHAIGYYFDPSRETYDPDLYVDYEAFGKDPRCELHRDLGGEVVKRMWRLIVYKGLDRACYTMNFKESPGFLNAMCTSVLLRRRIRSAVALMREGRIGNLRSAEPRLVRDFVELVTPSTMKHIGVAYLTAASQLRFIAKQEAQAELMLHRDLFAEPLNEAIARYEERAGLIFETSVKQTQNLPRGLLVPKRHLYETDDLHSWMVKCLPSGITSAMWYMDARYVRGIGLFIAQTLRKTLRMFLKRDVENNREWYTRVLRIAMLICTSAAAGYFEEAGMTANRIASVVDQLNACNSMMDIIAMTEGVLV